MKAFCFARMLCLSEALVTAVCACQERLTPEQEQLIETLNQREVPPWFKAAKLGIFMSDLYRNALS